MTDIANISLEYIFDKYGVGGLVLAGLVRVWWWVKPMLEDIKKGHLEFLKKTSETGDKNSEAITASQHLLVRMDQRIEQHGAILAKLSHSSSSPRKSNGPHRSAPPGN